ncbi:MAG: putative transport system permease protein [Verrucomicrobiota bacterium]|jgi:putative ABC transport system permease protein
MRLPLKYNLRHLQVRWRSTMATVVLTALVVAVFVMVLSMARGLRSTYLSSGDPRNLLVIRKGALAESSSQVTLDEVRKVRFLDGIARARGPGVGGTEPMISPELIVVITLQRPSGGIAHVQVRGLGPMGAELRPDLRLVAGRRFEPGHRECIVSRNVARRFPECGLGRVFRSGRHEWKVVGLFDARKTAYDSEIWIDADEAREAFNRTFYGSMVLRPSDPSEAIRIRARIEEDKSMRLRVLTEQDYFREQTKTAAPIQILGTALAVVMSVGAAFAAMNTLFASVGARGREIGTLRVLGFRRRAIYVSFLVESVAVALAGGFLGGMMALPMNGLLTGMFNWSTFSEVAFEFRVTAGLLGLGLLFALMMGVLGGLLPARWAARRDILDALRGG